MLPSWIRSRNCRPRLRYFLAIETTRRRLASTSSFLACSACFSPRWIVSSVRLQPLRRSSSASLCSRILRAVSFCRLSEDLLLLFLQLRRLAALGRRAGARCSRPRAAAAAPSSTRSLIAVDQAALDRLGELDAADRLREPRRAGAHRLPALRRGGTADSRRFWTSANLASRFLQSPCAFATASICFRTSRGALFDALVGDLFVVEDHQLADGALAGASAARPCR